MAKKKKEIIPTLNIGNKIYIINGQKVLLDSDLAVLYDVETRVLIQAVKRNIARFPNDFVFQLSKEEFDSLRSQFVISKEKPGKGGRRYSPYAFTEQGVAMLSTVLKSERALQVNIQIMRTFVKLREILLASNDVKRKVQYLERKYDDQFKMVFDAIKKLMAPKNKSIKKIGFKPKGKKS